VDLFQSSPRFGIDNTTQMSTDSRELVRQEPASTPRQERRSNLGLQVGEAFNPNGLGRKRGEFMGIPATGRQVRVWGMVIDRLEQGRIKDTHIIMDTLGLMTQLGVFPPRTS
jgi:hypothetical protein